MDSFSTKLSILADILVKKKTALLTILNICENQENLYDTPTTAERRDFLVAMGIEKQTQIDNVLECDQIFQQIFDAFGDEFENMGQIYPEKVRILQDGIKEILEIDIQIRAQEEKTKAAANAAWGKFSQDALKAPNPTNTNDILNKYRSNNRGGRR
ncbi:MAG: hypothetical protein FWE33_01605 [Defluviitaleaceae bacterium]|nr:hypothetical protein [Defluviitaleaceae bacterium]